MTKQQFIAGCIMCGYCTKKTAEKYAAEKDELTEKDFEEVHRLEQGKKSKAARYTEKWHSYQNTKSTKTGKALEMTGCGIGGAE